MIQPDQRQAGRSEQAHSRAPAKRPRDAALHRLRILSLWKGGFVESESRPFSPTQPSPRGASRPSIYAINARP